MSELLMRPFDDWVTLGHAAKTFLAMLALCSARMYAIALIFPPFGEEGMKGVTRNGFVLMIGFYVSWGQSANAIEVMAVGQLTLLVLKEAVIGLLLGFAASVVFWVAEAAGALIDNQSGFNNVQQSNPMSGSESTPIGNVLGQLSHACFWMLGGITVLIGLLFESFGWWSLTSMTPAWFELLLQVTASNLATLMRLTVMLAAPTLLMLLLIDLGFGLLGKAAEKLEPNSLAQPVKGVVAMLMVSLLIALFFHEARPLLALRHLEGEVKAWVGGPQNPR